MSVSSEQGGRRKPRRRGGGARDAAEVHGLHLAISASIRRSHEPRDFLVRPFNAMPHNEFLARWHFCEPSNEALIAGVDHVRSRDPQNRRCANAREAS